MISQLLERKYECIRQKIYSSPVIQLQISFIGISQICTLLSNLIELSQKRKRMGNLLNNQDLRAKNSKSSKKQKKIISLVKSGKETQSNQNLLKGASSKDIHDLSECSPRYSSKLRILWMQLTILKEIHFFLITFKIILINWMLFYIVEY